MRIYKSAVDLWLKLMTAGILILPIGISLIIGSLNWPGILICGLTAAFILWLYLATKYVITDETLIIHGGVIKVNIPLQEITSVTDSRSVMSSPAFSLDRLEIKYGADKMILISPKDKARFLADLDWPVSA
jgi:uncharacterized membrane protein YdbT with pleckstrin-like domain